jgi:Bacteriocin-protection, YdeI or OmpD-Associated/Domain of unknown function (DUF1905)
VPEFDAVLEEAARGPGCGIRLPFDPKDEFGAARAPIAVSVNGAQAFRTTVAVYSGIAWVGLRRDQQSAMNVQVGDRVHVAVVPDDRPRVVDLPPELVDALTSDTRAREAFDRLSYTHRKEYARWVGDAKREPTRLARAEKAVAMLRQGVRTPG